MEKKPTTGQQHALGEIREFMHSSNNGILTISGAAGTGKTTLLAMLKKEFSKTIIAAPTNKAVDVLRKKGFENATTLDRILNKSVYCPTYREPTDEDRAFYISVGQPVPNIITIDNYEKINLSGVDAPVVIDEASMVDACERDLACSLYPKVIFVGDGYQLPPVNGIAWFQDWKHDIELTQIVRTAELSEITELANMVRRQDATWSERDWTVEVLTMKMDRLRFSPEIANWDIMLAHTNATCDEFNRVIRKQRNLFDPLDPTLPVKGDQLLSWTTSHSQNIMRSSAYDVVGAKPVSGGYMVRIACPQTRKIEIVNVNKCKLIKQSDEMYIKNFSYFSFGHCITAHKSQGSEWNNVIVYAGDKKKRHDNYWSWLYTAVTRAKKNLVVAL